MDVVGYNWIPTLAMGGRDQALTCPGYLIKQDASLANGMSPLRLNCNNICHRYVRYSYMENV